MTREASGLSLRLPRAGDQAVAVQAQAELEPDGFDFLLKDGAESWREYLERIDDERRGVDLPPGRVPATMFFAVVAGDVVGRVHIRHALTPSLLRVGGHIGYGVRPAFRRNGYATQMLRLGLEELDALGVARVLVTCDDSNVASIRTIERNRGVLQDVVPVESGPAKRRYWIGN